MSKKGGILRLRLNCSFAETSAMNDVGVKETWDTQQQIVIAKRKEKKRSESLRASASAGSPTDDANTGASSRRRRMGAAMKQAFRKLRR